MRKVFNFLEKIVNSIINDLYEYLYQKKIARNSSLKRPVFYYQRQHAFCNILVDKNAAGVRFKIITVIALHHPVSGAGSVLQKQKKPCF